MYIHIYTLHTHLYVCMYVFEKPLVCYVTLWDSDHRFTLLLGKKENEMGTFWSSRVSSNLTLPSGELSG